MASRSLTISYTLTRRTRRMSTNTNFYVKFHTYSYSLTYDGYKIQIHPCLDVQNRNQYYRIAFLGFQTYLIICLNRLVHILDILWFYIEILT